MSYVHGACISQLAESTNAQQAATAEAEAARGGHMRLKNHHYQRPKSMPPPFFSRGVGLLTLRPQGLCFFCHEKGKKQVSHVQSPAH